MIRESTPLPRRPRAESKLLDAMLKMLRCREPLPSSQIVTIVKLEFASEGIVSGEFTYSIRTWDMDLQAFTPQEGLSLPWEGLTLWQLKAALKELKDCGYQCHRRRDATGCYDNNDVSVLVERSDEQTDGTR